MKDLLLEYDIFGKKVKNIAPQFLHVPDSEAYARKTSKIPPVKIEYPTRYRQNRSV